MSKTMTPLRAIRANCLNCMGGLISEVRRCPSEDCPLYQYRFGKNPKRKGQGNIANLRKNAHLAGVTKI